MPPNDELRINRMVVLGIYAYVGIHKALTGAHARTTTKKTATKTGRKGVWSVKRSNTKKQGRDEKKHTHGNTNPKE